MSDMSVVWDSAKATSNARKHGIRFADAAVALEDENALTILDQDSEEFRFKTLALSPEDNVLLVVHVEEDEDTIRIISARKAEAKEREQYYSGDYHG